MFKEQWETYSDSESDVNTRLKVTETRKLNHSWIEKIGELTIWSVQARALLHTLAHDSYDDSKHVIYVELTPSNFMFILWVLQIERLP